MVWRCCKTAGNQINYILCKKKNLNTMNNVRSYGGASTDSDHYLVIVKYKIKIEMKQVEKLVNKKWNMTEFKNDDIRMAYKEVIDKKFKEGEEDKDIELDWASIKEGIIDTAANITENTKSTSKISWFDMECKEEIEQKIQH